MLDESNDRTDESTVANPRITPKTEPGSENGRSDGKTVSHNPSVSTPLPPPTIYRQSAYVPPPPPLTRESAARERMRRRRVKNRGAGGDWAWVIIAVALLGVVITVSLSVVALLRVAGQRQEVLPTAPVVSILPTPVDARTVNSSNSSTGGLGDVLTLPDGENIIIEPWDGQSRFTVLVMGLDRRPGETGLAYRTDTMLLVSLDPVTHSIGILSIPRDLFVEVPGYSSLQRVNSPMVLGELQRPGYGPELAMKTVQWNLGMRVQDYLAVDFNAFITLVDAVGGVDVDVSHNISDPQYPNMYYGYDPFYITAGPHHLDGATALKYARTRHGSSDFERAQRQQQVLFALRDRITSLDMLPGLILQAPMLWQTLNEDVYTGLTLEQVIQLALYAKDIPTENIHTGVIDSQYVRSYTTPEGAQVLIPNRGALGPLMVQVFGASYSE